MAGIDPINGQIMGEVADIMQSLKQIATTPIGSRVQRRPFGFDATLVVDSPANASGILQIMAVMADAYARWEKRVDIQSIQVVPEFDGKATIRTTATIKTSGLTVVTETPYVGIAA